MGTGSSKLPPGRVIMIGLDAAGKTTLMYKMKCGEVTTSIPTIGFNIESMPLNRRTDLLAWDVGGRSPMRRLWLHYLQGVQGVVFVVDSADRDRMEQAAEELEQFMSVDELRDAPLLLLANKADLPNAMSLAEVEAAMRLPQLQRRQQPCAAFAVCAVTFAGVAEAFGWLAGRIKKSQEEVGGGGGDGLQAGGDSAGGGKLQHLAESWLPKTLQKLLFA